MMVRVTLAVALLCLYSPDASAQWVDGYMRKNGTYVNPHQRTRPDGNPFNNIGSQLNGNGAVPYGSPVQVDGYIRQDGTYVSPYTRHQRNRVEPDLSVFGKFCTVDDFQTGRCQ